MSIYTVTFSPLGEAKGEWFDTFVAEVEAFVSNNSDIILEFEEALEADRHRAFKIICTDLKHGLVSDVRFSLEVSLRRNNVEGLLHLKRNTDALLDWYEQIKSNRIAAASDSEALLAEFRLRGYSPHFLVSRGMPKTKLRWRSESAKDAWHHAVAYGGEWHSWTAFDRSRPWFARNPWAEQGMEEYVEKNKPAGWPAGLIPDALDVWVMERNRLSAEYKQVLLEELRAELVSA